MGQDVCSVKDIYFSNVFRAQARNSVNVHCYIVYCAQAVDWYGVGKRRQGCRGCHGATCTMLPLIFSTGETHAHTHLRTCAFMCLDQSGLFFFFFLLPTLSVWKFLGQELHPSHSYDDSSSNTRPITPYASAGTLRVGFFCKGPDSKYFRL